MIIPVLGFVASFLAVFLIYLTISRFLAQRAQQKEDLQNWEEGQRRRELAEKHEAWRENQRTYLK
jgi:NADH:ubiquinone oxidoreductase subunit 3 (subunit A)